MSGRAGDSANGSSRAEVPSTVLRNLSRAEESTKLSCRAEESATVMSLSETSAPV